MNKNIKIPESHYIRLVTNRKGGQIDNLPLGFMTPDGTDKAALSRKDTVDNWAAANSRRTGDTPPSMVLLNTVVSGFRFLDTIGRYDGGVKWRIEDPRGFELEISSGNLMYIIEHTVIDGGVLLNPCIWSRDGAENFLLPMGSPLYEDAVANTDRLAKKVDKSDLKIGMNVVLKNGLTGRYMGNPFLVESTSEGLVLGKRRHIVTNSETKTIHAMAAINVAEITDGEILTTEEAERELLSYVKDDWNRPYYSIVDFTFDKTIDVVCEAVETRWGR